jgi:hypothetical protein
MWFVVAAAFVQMVLSFLARSDTTSPESAGRRTVLFGVASLAAFGLTSAAAYRQDRETQEFQDKLTGGDSQPIVFPHVGEKETVLSVNAIGKYDLSNVTITLTGERERGREPIQGYVGNIRPGVPREFRLHAVPQITASSPTEGGEPIDVWILKITATNGTFTDTLSFKKGKCGWAFEDHIEKDGEPRPDFVIPSHWSSDYCN